MVDEALFPVSKVISGLALTGEGLLDGLNSPRRNGGRFS
jgi:hypothetical protein